jgi:hypothetical protein
VLQEPSRHGSCSVQRPAASAQHTAHSTQRTAHLTASANTSWSPAATAAHTIWHMQPTMAATLLLSAPPLRGSRKPLAPALQEHIHTGGQFKQSARTQSVRERYVMSNRDIEVLTQGKRQTIYSSLAGSQAGSRMGCCCQLTCACSPTASRQAPELSPPPHQDTAALEEARGGETHCRGGSTGCRAGRSAEAGRGSPATRLFPACATQEQNLHHNTAGKIARGSAFSAHT